MLVYAPHVAVTFRVRETLAVEVSRSKGGAGEAASIEGMRASVPRASPTGSVPDPFEDADALEALGDRIATLAAHIHAAEHRLLELVAEFDRRRGWELGGHRSCAHWLAFRTGIDLGAARERVRAARALVDLPETGAAMRRGELSFSAVRALTRVATPETEADLLELARGCTAARVERLVRSWKRGSRMDEVEWERERHARRAFSVFPDADGMYVVRGRLTPEAGALLMRAIEAAGDALWRERGPGGDRGSEPRAAGNVSAETSRGDISSRGHSTERRDAAARRRADALALLAERALAAGFREETDGGADPEQTEVDTGADTAGGTGDVSAETSGERPTAHAASETARPVPVSGSRAGRYQVLLHVDADTLVSDREPGRSELEDGTRVSAETSRRLACDAAVVEVTHGPDDSVLNVGRRMRTIPPALRRALDARDRGCRFPGCGLRFTDAHHVRHWADGGETSLHNLVLLCSHHHRLVHEGGWEIEAWPEGRLAFRDPRGQLHVDAPRPAPPLHGDPVTALVRANRRRGADPHGWTAGARWKGEADIPDDVWFRALEAVAAAER
jgi:hypothetical protein